MSRITWLWILLDLPFGNALKNRKRGEILNESVESVEKSVNFSNSELNKPTFTDSYPPKEEKNGSRDEINERFRSLTTTFRDSTKNLVIYTKPAAVNFLLSCDNLRPLAEFSWKRRCRLDRRKYEEDAVKQFEIPASSEPNCWENENTSKLLPVQNSKSMQIKHFCSKRFYQ